MLKEIENWHGADFTNTRLYDNNSLLTAEESCEIIIDRMIELDIKDAKGLGDYCEELICDTPKSDNHTQDTKDKTPTLAAIGFEIAANMPTEKQAQEIYDEPIVTRSLEEYNND